MVRRGQYKANLALLEHIAGTVADTSFQASVGGQLKSEGGAVEVCRLFCIPNVELDVVGAKDRQKVFLDCCSGLFQFDHGWHWS